MYRWRYATRLKTATKQRQRNRMRNATDLKIGTVRSIDREDFGVDKSASLAPGCVRPNSLTTRPWRIRGNMSYTQGDSDVVSLPAGFRRHLVGKTLIKCIFFTVISPKYALLASQWSSTDIFINQRIECHVNNTINLRSLDPHITPCYTHKMTIVSWP